MKKLSAVFLLLSASAMGQTQQNCDQQYASQPEPQRTASINACYAQVGRQQSGQQQGQNRPNPVTQSCNTIYSQANASLELLSTRIPSGQTAQYFETSTPVAVTNTTPAPTQPDPNLAKQGITVGYDRNVRTCRGFELLAQGLGNNGDLDAIDSRPSQDGRIICYKKSGVTADWDSCVSALGMYNSIIVAEAAMQVFQGVQTNRAQNQAQNEFAQRNASGDGQNAAFDAQTANLNNAKQLNQQQAAAYAAAVAALYSKIQSWIKESPEGVARAACGNRPMIAENTLPPTPNPMEIYRTAELIPIVNSPEECTYAARQVMTFGSTVFANREAKAAFTTAAMMFAAKAIQAGIKANQLGDIAKKVEEAKKSTEDPYNPATFGFCEVNKTDARCTGPVSRTSGSGLQDGGFSFGEGFGSNAFNPLGDQDTLGGIDPLPLPGGETIADTNNPFADDARAADKILDPAGAASLQPGGAGGGGGGGGGAPGGGSASLGNDTPGADEGKKESDIKANKADGKYNLAGGSGFQAIKPVKEGNPFANLFDGKAGGGLNEDRSIASGDIDGKDSGIFAKISKRYGQVQADKRIEAKNLEE